MAAVQWNFGKMHGSTEAKSSMLHDDKDMRMVHGHSNPDLDTSKTHENWSYRGLTYREKCKNYDALMDEVKVKRRSSGKNQNVTLQKLVIPVPKEMQDGPNYDRAQCVAWAADVCDILNKRYGKLMIDATMHFDEIHMYLDPRKDRADSERYVWSRAHMHVAVVPAVEQDGELYLNAKKFSSKANIRALNNEIQRMTEARYGMTFMDGTGKNGKTVSVKDLKALTAEAMREEGLILAEEREAVEALRTKTQREMTDANAELDAKRREVDASAKESERIAEETRRSVESLRRAGEAEKEREEDERKSLEEMLERIGYEFEEGESLEELRRVMLDEYQKLADDLKDGYDRLEAGRSELESRRTMLDEKIRKAAALIDEIRAETERVAGLSSEGFVVRVLGSELERTAEGRLMVRSVENAEAAFREDAKRERETTVRTLHDKWDDLQVDVPGSGYERS